MEDKSILHDINKYNKKKKYTDSKKTKTEEKLSTQDRVEEDLDEGLIGKRVVSSLEDMRTIYATNTSKHTKDNQWMQSYAHSPPDAKAPSIITLDTISEDVSSHFSLPSDALTPYIYSVDPSSTKPTADQTEPNPYLVRASGHLLSNDYDEVDDNKLREVNNDVEFKQYSYTPSNKKTKKMKYKYDNSIIEYSQRIPHELKVSEFPHLVDEMIQYMETLTEKDYNISILRLLSTYTDYYHTDCFSLDTYKFKKTYMTHIMNHTLYYKHKSIESQQVNGYTRCRTCILVPIKLDCIEIVDILVDILKSIDSECPIVNHDKFTEMYNDENEMMNDDFRSGIKINRTGCSLMADYNNSDIFICSPLSLLSLRDKKKNGSGKLDSKKGKQVAEQEEEEFSYGFLSSVEILVVDKAHIHKMNDYRMVDECIRLMNNIPKHHETTTDFNTIRDYYVDNLSKFYRQTIVYTDFFFADLNLTLDQYGLNYKGSIRNKISYNCIFDDFKGNSKFRIEFQRMDIDDPHTEFDSHFNYFINQVWYPYIRTGIRNQTVVFVSKYEEFVRLKQHFKYNDMTKGGITTKGVSSARRQTRKKCRK